MIFKALLFSLFFSILSLVVVVYAPIEISVRDKGNVYSPYWNEIEELRLKTQKGLHPSAPEWKRLDELTEKNNQWHEQEKNEYLRNSATSGRKAWKKKSNYVSPVIMLLWGIAFYYFFRRRLEAQSLYALTFPVVLLIAQVMSLLEVILISLVVLVIWFWGNFSSKNTENEPTTLE